VVINGHSARTSHRVATVPSIWSRMRPQTDPFVAGNPYLIRKCVFPYQLAIALLLEPCGPHYAGGPGKTERSRAQWQIRAATLLPLGDQECGWDFWRRPGVEAPAVGWYWVFCSQNPPFPLKAAMHC